MTPFPTHHFSKAQRAESLVSIAPRLWVRDQGQNGMNLLTGTQPIRRAMGNGHMLEPLTISVNTLLYPRKGMTRTTALPAWNSGIYQIWRHHLVKHCWQGIPERAFHASEPLTGAEMQAVSSIIRHSTTLNMLNADTFFLCHHTT